MQHVKNILQNISDANYWIGISDIIDENRWIYSSDLQQIKVNNFQRGEPNGHAGANCVALWKPFHGLWADEDCGSSYNFICQSLNE